MSTTKHQTRSSHDEDARKDYRAQQLGGGGGGHIGGHRCGGGIRGGGGAWVLKADFKPTPNNTNNTKGWKEYNSEGRPPHHTREKKNFGGYCWTHGFDPRGLGHNSKTCKRQKDVHVRLAKTIN